MKLKIKIQAGNNLFLVASTPYIFLSSIAPQIYSILCLIRLPVSMERVGNIHVLSDNWIFSWCPAGAPAPSSDDQRPDLISVIIEKQ